MITHRDCAAIAPDQRIRLASGHLRRLEPAQRVLVAPLDYPDLDSWRVAAVRAVSVALGGDVGAFELHLPGEAPEAGFGVPEDRLGEWTEHLPTLPQGFNLHERMLQLRVGTRSTTWASHLSWFYTTAYYNDFLVRVGGFDPLALTTAAPGPTGHANIRIHHSDGTGPRFGAEELEMARLLHPAFEAGVRTAVRAASVRHALSASIDSLQNGVLAYDLRGRIVHRNAGFSALAGTDAAEKIVLRAAREMALGLVGSDLVDRISPEHARRTVRCGEQRVVLTAVRVREGVFAMRPVVLITARSSEAPLPNRDGIRRRFGLTRRQAEVALLLAQRLTNPEIAEAFCISEHTVRSHVEAVMSKLGVHDRREIAATLRGGA